MSDATLSISRAALIGDNDIFSTAEEFAHSAMENGYTPSPRMDQS